MKTTRILALALVLCMMLALVGCGANPYKKVDVGAHISFGDFDYTKIGITADEYNDFMEAAKRDLIEALQEGGNVKVNSLSYTDKSQTGDKVTVAYTGRIPVDGLAAENVSVTIGTDVPGLPTGFDEALKGLGAEGEITFQLTFPADFATESLRGRVVWFTVKVTSLSCGHSDLETAHAVAEEGDTLVISYVGREEYVLHRTETVESASKKVDAQDDKTAKLPAKFDDLLVGKKVGDKVTNFVEFPVDVETYGEKAGKKVSYELEILSFTCPTDNSHTEHTEVSANDTVTFKYTAKWDYTPASSLGTAEFTVGGEDGAMPAGFAAALAGIQKDGTKNLLLTYPTDHANADLAGREVQFSLTMVKIARSGYKSVHAGDKITLDYVGDVVEAIPEGTANPTIVTTKKLDVKDAALDLGTQDSFPAAFVENLIGVHAGEQKVFYVTYPTDTAYGDLSGLVIRFTVRVKSITETAYKNVSDAASTVVTWLDNTKLDYSGIMVGETTPFDKGTATNQTLEIGSKSFIEGFEAALVGAPLGVEIPIYLTFPDPYTSDTAKSGKDVVFYVTLHSLDRLPSGMVSADGKIVLTLDQINTALERTAEKGNLYSDVATWEKEIAKQNLLELTQSKLIAASTVSSYPKKAVTGYAKDYVEMYEMYAAQMGYTLEGYVSMMGYSPVEKFYDSAITYAKSQVKNEMALLLVAEKANITLTDEDLDNYIKDNYAVNGYKSAGQFKRKVGKDTIAMVALCEKVADQLATWASTHNNIAI